MTSLVSSGECWASAAGKKELPSLQSCCYSTYGLTHAAEKSFQQIKDNISAHGRYSVV